jgi:G3E family GTPase
MREIVTEYQPQLLIVETSGSAFPGPIAWEIRRLSEAGVLNVRLDALINVIDVANFQGMFESLCLVACSIELAISCMPSLNRLLFVFLVMFGPRYGRLRG